MRRLAPCIAALAAAIALSPGQAHARHAATCTATQKRAAQAALAAYRKAMPKQRTAYFKRHKKPAQRKAFVKKQQRKLKALKAAAGCSLRAAPAPVTPPAPPPAAPPAAPPPAAAPRDTTAPRLDYASVLGSTIRARFSEDVALAGPSFAVSINGAVSTPTSVGAQGQTVALTLAVTVAGEDVVTLDYRGGVQDAAGNAAEPVSSFVVANATPTPCSFMVGNGGLAGPGAMNEGPTDLTLHKAAAGTLRGIVLGVDFPDAPASESMAALHAQIFPPASTAYDAMSYGKFSLATTAPAQWYRLPHTSAYYGLRAADGAGRKDEYVTAAIQAADATVDFSAYDVVYLLPAAGAAADFATGTQRPAGSGFTTSEGQIRYAVLLGTEQLARVPDAVVHETGHVLGLPDLYADLTAVGGWDPMSFSSLGAEFLAWHRWKLGWLEPSQVRCAGPGRAVEATVTPLESPGGVKQVVAPIDATRALVVENRQPFGLDSRVCDKGVLVYTIDGTVTYPGTPIRVAPVRPGTDTDTDKQRRCGPRYDATLDLGLGEVSSYHDAPTGIRVDLVGAEGSSYVVRVSR